MKLFVYVLIVLAIILVVYNFTQIDFNDPLGKESIVALITVLAGLCAILLLVILRMSKKIDETLKKKS